MALEMIAIRSFIGIEGYIKRGQKFLVADQNRFDRLLKDEIAVDPANPGAGYTPPDTPAETPAETLPPKKDFFELIQLHNKAEGSLMVKINGDRRFSVAVPLGGDEYAVYAFYKDDNDDYIKTDEGRVSTLGDGYSQTTEKNVDSFEGTWVTGSPPSYYTTTVGARAYFTFTGNAFGYRHYVDNRGGMFRLTVDGVEAGTFSTHVNAIPAEELEYATRALRLFEGFSDGEHTAFVEFIGADPANPSASGAARGWLFYDTRPENNKTIRQYVTALTETVKFPLMYKRSNKEYAFSTRPAADAETAHYWLPDHGTGSAFAISQTVLFDGEPVTDWTPAGFEPVDQVMIQQKMRGIYPPTQVQLAEITETKTVNKNGVTFTTRFDWIVDSLVTSGYVCMFPIDRQFADRLYTNLGNDYDATIFDPTHTRTDLKADKGKADAYAYYHNSSDTEKKNYVVAMKMHNFEQTIREGAADRYENVVWLEHRSAEMQKLYPQTLDKHTFKSGDSYIFGGTFIIGKLMDAGKAIK